MMEPLTNQDPYYSPESVIVQARKKKEKQLEISQGVRFAATKLYNQFKGDHSKVVSKMKNLGKKGKPWKEPLLGEALAQVALKEDATIAKEGEFVFQRIRLYRRLQRQSLCSEGVLREKVEETLAPGAQILFSYPQKLKIFKLPEG